MIVFYQLLWVSRPRFWIYLLGPYMLGVAAATPPLSKAMSWEGLLWALLFTLPASLLVYGVNDIFDYETDKFNPKKRGYEFLLSPERRGGVIRVMAVVLLPFVVLAFPLPLLARASFLLFLFLSFFYSAPPIRAKARPVLDSMFNVLYVVPGLLGYALISGALPDVSVMLSAALWCMAMHAYSAVPDIVADTKAGLSTIATLLGTSGTLLFCLGCYLMSAALVFTWAPLIIGTLGAVYVGFMIVSMRKKDPGSLFKVYRLFPYINSFVGMMLFFTILVQRFLK